MQEIDYTFDAVNNITGISNAAGVLNNGLGGTYRHAYNYDNSYRLISSKGLWNNNNNSLNYQLALTYTNDGRIQSKTQTATTLIGGALSNFAYNNHYTYDANQPHTVKRVLDAQNQVNQDFKWDANGNLISHRTQFPVNNRRDLCWDEENRLMAVGDDNYTSYYIYDNSGERTYKLTGLNTLMNINGRWVNFATMDNPTLYTSAYLVAGLQGYTKHYYAGSERVSSAIGLGGLENINDPLPIEFGGSWDAKSGSLMEEMNRTIVECLKNDYNIATSLHFLHGMTTPTAGTMDRYFYRPDHLGSTLWVTDSAKNGVQYCEYLPYGEPFIDQRSTTWSSRYTFSGKERDNETGYSYFGARYYHSDLSIWLSVDPMSDKYPNLTPYAYCANNPVNAIDPDGRDAIYITFLKYKADGYPFTGHAGVLLIDNKTGLTKYYEYGRYNNVKKGLVRHYSVPNVEMKDGMPTAESLNKVLTKISNESGKGQVLEGAYVPSNNFDIMNNYAKEKLSENSDENRTPYNALTNNCGTFADDVIKQDKTVDAPLIIDPRPVSIIDEYQDKFTPISYDPKKGTSIKLTEQTTIYNNQTKTTEVKQNWWQKLWYDTK